MTITPSLTAAADRTWMLMAAELATGMAPDSPLEREEADARWLIRSVDPAVAPGTLLLTSGSRFRATYSM
jgi:hypothetical protein